LMTTAQKSLRSSQETAVALGQSPPRDAALLMKARSGSGSWPKLAIENKIVEDPNAQASSSSMNL
jgi:hypothetical protein